MAKILVAFFNCIDDAQNKNAMPIFYEGFIKGLDAAGNNVAVFSHKGFGQDFGEIDDNTRAFVTEFEPDLCIIFNNSFYDLSSVVSCPIVIYEVDSPRYFSNKQRIRDNPDRYLFFILQSDSRKPLMEEYGVSPKNIFYVPCFSEVYADEQMKSEVNISFIGSRFLMTSARPFFAFLTGNPSDEERQMFQNCVNEIRNNPQVTPAELVYKYKIMSELVACNLNIPDILMTLSAEKRVKVLSAVAELGLDLYGTENWGNEYYLNIDLNFSYVNKKVYSIRHNQDIYNSSKIGINVSHLQATSGFPWRVMDIMASNACLVTDYHSDFKVLFPEVADILPVYDNAYEAYDLCRKLIRDEQYRQEIVLRCNEVINTKYRFKNLLPKLEEYSGVKLQN